MHESNTYLEDIQIKYTLFMYAHAGTRHKHTLKTSRYPCTWNEAAADEGSRLNLVKEWSVFYGRAYTVTLQLNSKWINVCICLCVHVWVWGASGARPNELSVCISNKSSVQRPRHCHPGPWLTLLGC